MVMSPEEQDAFLRDAVGPAFRAAGVTAKVILYDHNCDRPDYPLTTLKDDAARPFAAGSGFHLYGGEITAMSQVHDAFPDKGLYFTEQMVVERSALRREHGDHAENNDNTLEPVAQPVARIVVGAMRNWSRNVLLWNLAADPHFGPHTNEGGCPVCQGAITLDGDKVERNIAFYTIAHAAKFVPAGSHRIDSTDTGADLANVAWKTPAGKTVLLVANRGKQPSTFSVTSHGKAFEVMLGAGSTETFVW
jgi:glucosylceramidase